MARTNRNNFRLLPGLALARARDVAPFFERALAGPLADYIKRIREGETAENAVKVEALNMTAASDEVKRTVSPPLGVEAFNTTGAWFGKSRFVSLFPARGPVGVFGKALKINVEGADELVAAQIAAPMEIWIANTSVIETQTTSNILQKMFVKAQGIAGADDSLTPRQLADVIFMNQAIADNMTELGRTMTTGRSKMLARTVTTWAYGEGSVLQYEDAGVQAVEWFATLDDATREWHAALHGTIVATRQNFVAKGQTFLNSDGTVSTAGLDVQHPPLDPNCRCALLPVV